MASSLRVEVTPEGIFGSPLRFGSDAHDRAECVAAGKDGSLYVAGYTAGLLAGQQTNGYDSFLAKYVDHELVWTKQFGVGGDDYARAVLVAEDGSIFVAGATNGAIATPEQQVGQQDAYVARFTPSGDVSWIRQFGTSADDFFGTIAQAPEGHLVALGGTTGIADGDGFGQTDVLLVAYSQSGDVLLTRQFGTDAIEHATNSKVLSNGDVVLAGPTFGSFGTAHFGGDDVFVARYGWSEDSLVWVTQFGAADSDTPTSIAASGDKLFVGGTTRSTLDDSLVSPMPGTEDGYLASLDSVAGHVRWLRQIGGQDTTNAAGVAVDSSGNALVVGSSQDDFGGVVGGMYVAKYTGDGEALWLRQDTSAGASPRALTIDRTGTLGVFGLAAGEYGGAALGGTDLFVVQIR